MKVAVIDVGSNSVRLLVASVGKRGEVKALRRDRVFLRLGESAYALGAISDEKIADAVDVAATYARAARKAGAERLETIVTAPARQASNGSALARALGDATRARVVVLAAEEEGRLAWEGAVRRHVGGSDSEIVAVVDLGGGSCELAVGSRRVGPTWVRSVDSGALRVTRAYLDGDPPSRASLVTARAEIDGVCSKLDPPHAGTALAAGGSARAIGRLIGRRYGSEELERLIERLSRARSESVASGRGVSEERAETLLGGALVLAEISRRLGRDLEVGRGGLREGAALALAGAEAAAA